jgi:hypothetical protein
MKKDHTTGAIQRDSFVCPRWIFIFIFDSDQAQINSASSLSKIAGGIVISSQIMDGKMTEWRLLFS